MHWYMVCVCMYINTYILAIHMYVGRHVYRHMYALHICMCMYVDIYTCTLADMHGYICVYVCTYTYYTCIYECIYLDMHIGR